METTEIKDFIKSTENSPIEWAGIRLQAIADRLFMLATDFLADMITTEQIKNQFEHIIKVN